MKTDENVAIVYTQVDESGSYKLLKGVADILSNGQALVEVNDETMVMREAGEYMKLLEFQKISQGLYKRAVELAYKKVKGGQNGNE